MSQKYKHWLPQEGNFCKTHEQMSSLQSILLHGADFSTAKHTQLMQTLHRASLSFPFQDAQDAAPPPPPPPVVIHSRKEDPWL